MQELQGSTTVSTLKGMKRPKIREEPLVLKLPDSYPIAFRYTHLSNLKELQQDEEKKKSLLTSEQDTEDMAEVVEKWVDDGSRQLFVSFIRYIS